MEIERKFLVKYLPDLTNSKKIIIEQAYLNLNPEIRIRKENDKYFYTTKSSGDLVRRESNKEIDSLTYYKLKENIIGNIINKTRYLINYNNYLLEIDIYEGFLEGLIVVEVEFETEEEAHLFEIPMFFGREITYESEYKNKNLSRRLKNN